MFGSVGSIGPRNYAEYIVITMMMIIGSMVWAWVIGSLCGILATLNPHGTAFQNLMDELNHFMRINNFSGDHRVRLREFFRQTQDYNRIHGYDKLLLKMSAQLRGDTALVIGTATLDKIWYFWGGECEPQFLSLVALNMHATIYETREVIPTYDLTVIDRGVVARRLVILTKGAVLGTDCVIPDHLVRFRPLEAAISLTFVQTNVVSRATLFRQVVHFPGASKSLHHAAAIYSLKGAFRLAWTIYKQALRAQGVLGARVTSNEVHSGALQYTAGSAVLAAFNGALNVQDTPPEVMIDLAEQKKQEKLRKYSYFRAKGSTRHVCASIKGIDSSSPTAAPGCAASGVVGVSAMRHGGGHPSSHIANVGVSTSVLPLEEDVSDFDDDDPEDFGEPVAMHGELRQLRRTERRNSVALGARVDAVRHEMNVSVSGVHAKLEGVIGAISMLERAVRGLAKNGGSDGSDGPSSLVAAAAVRAVEHGHRRHHSSTGLNTYAGASKSGRIKNGDRGAAPPPVEQVGRADVWDDPAPLATATRSRAATVGARAARSTDTSNATSSTVTRPEPRVAVPSASVAGAFLSPTVVDHATKPRRKQRASQRGGAPSPSGTSSPEVRATPEPLSRGAEALPDAAVDAMQAALARAEGLAVADKRERRAQRKAEQTSGQLDA